MNGADPPKVQARATSRGRKVVRGVSMSYAATVANVVLGLAVTPIILVTIGAGKYGLWAILLQAQGYIGMLDFGITTGSVRTLAVAGVNHRLPEARVLRTVLGLYSRISLGVAIVGLSVASVLPSLLPLGGERPITVFLALAVLVLGSTVLMPLSTCTDWLMARQQMGLLNGLLLIRAVIEAAAGVTFVLCGGGLIGLAAAQVVAASVFYGIACRAMLAQVPASTVLLERADSLVSQEVWSIMKLTFVQKIGAQLARNSDALLIGVIVGPAAVTVYVLTLRFLQAAVSLVSRVSPLLLPGLSELWESAGPLTCAGTYVRAARLVFAALIAVGIVAAALTRPFVTVWVGAENCGPNSLVWLGTLAAVLTAFGSVPQVLLTAANRLRAITRGSVFEAVLKIAVGLLLLRQWGLPGLVVGSIVAWIGGYGVTAMREVAAALGVPPLRLVRQTLLEPLLVVGVPVAGVLAAAARLPGTGTTVWVVRGIAICTGSAAALAIMEWRHRDVTYCWKLLASAGGKR